MSILVRVGTVITETLTTDIFDKTDDALFTGIGRRKAFVACTEIHAWSFPLEEAKTCSLRRDSNSCPGEF